MSKQKINILLASFLLFFTACSSPTETSDATPTLLATPTSQAAASLLQAQTHSTTESPHYTQDSVDWANDKDDAPHSPRELFPREQRLAPKRLVIPAIALDAPVEAVGWHVETHAHQTVSVWDVPDHFAAGWLKTSAPFGQPGNTVMDGHHNINGQVFKDLVKLEPGDLITLYAASHARIYSVAQRLILKEAGEPPEVRQANAQYISASADERLTLVTCWPQTDKTHRLIIIAFPTLAPSDPAPLDPTH